MRDILKQSILIEDGDRRKAASVLDEVTFVTNPMIEHAMVAAALDSRISLSAHQFGLGQAF
jgi:hypothetical protein